MLERGAPAGHCAPCSGWPRQPLSAAAADALEEANQAKLDDLVSRQSPHGRSACSSAAGGSPFPRRRIWFRRLLDAAGESASAALEPDVLIDSSSLPGDAPRDPADRIILATARGLGSDPDHPRPADGRLRAGGPRQHASPAEGTHERTITCISPVDG